MKKLTDEQFWIDNLVRTFRRRMFVEGESEAQCTWEARMLCAVHVARNKHLELKNPLELIEDLAVDVKPMACLIIERAKKAGRS